MKQMNTQAMTAWAMKARALSLVCLNKNAHYRGFSCQTGSVKRMQFRSFEEYAREQGIETEVIPEAQNSDYESGVATIDGAQWHIRTARNTPTKPGAFVAFWHRDADGATAPFAADEVAAGLLVFVRQERRRGVFQFTPEHLESLGITAGKYAGKGGFRVYPAWSQGLNRQAAATQRAQSTAFREY